VIKKENQINRQGFDKSVLTLLAFVLITLLVASAMSCIRNEEKSDKIGVVVTILPQAEFVEKVGSDKVNITVMVPPGADLHTYEPTPSQMTALSQAQIYTKVGSGVEFELTWMDKLIEQNEDILVVDCSQGIDLIEMVGEHDHEDEEDEHEHGTLDPHIWMSPANAKIMVQNICDGLVQVDPDNQAYYKENRDAYLQELTQLDQDISDGLSGVENRRFMVYHPSFGYFAKEYDLIMMPIEEEGKEPTGPGITYVIEQAKEYNIKVIFASPQFNQESAKFIASAIGGKVILIDPLARDYINNMHALSDELVQVTDAGKQKEVFRPLSWILFAIGVVAILITVGVISYNLVRGRKTKVIHGR